MKNVLFLNKNHLKFFYSLAIIILISSIVSVFFFVVQQAYGNSYAFYYGTKTPGQYPTFCKTGYTFDPIDRTCTKVLTPLNYGTIRNAQDIGFQRIINQIFLIDRSNYPMVNEVGYLVFDGSSIDTSINSIDLVLKSNLSTSSYGVCYKQTSVDPLGSDLAAIQSAIYAAGYYTCSNTSNVPIAYFEKENYSVAIVNNKITIGLTTNSSTTEIEMTNPELIVQYFLSYYDLYAPSLITVIDNRENTQLSDEIIGGFTILNLYKNSLKIAEIPVDAKTDIDWTTAIIDIDPVLSKSIFHWPNGYTNLPGYTNLASGYSLFTPKLDNHNSIRICPGAASLADISDTCTGGYNLSDEAENVTIVQIDGKSYWKVSGLTGTGIMGSTLDLSRTGQNTNIISKISFLTITILLVNFTASRYKKYKNIF